ncbi:hypothetical protein SAMN05216262_101434 [Colwellia chukchiensis]|uniref:Uncharacterized protein n=1 Tax=Colwellia chukchiensis TaxID=641665 RepID=A0A1H7H9L0_9GAMM|nr:hypothetical protein [Colwellia chukchiensis]SEK46974.1 hypothetical protein SAMN05216262_101434 [Colwellia chukchiensis]
MQNNRKMLLLVLLVLLIARFVIVPIVDWQDEKLASIAANSNNLHKSEQVIARSEKIATELAHVKQLNQTLSDKYFQQANLNDFKLKLQQQLESLFSQHNLKVKNFSWVAHIPGDVVQERANISFEGEIKNVVALQLAMAQLPQLLQIIQWNFPIRNMSETSLGTTRGQLLVAAYNVAPTKLANYQGEG